MNENKSHSNFIKEKILSEKERDDQIDALLDERKIRMENVARQQEKENEALLDKSDSENLEEQRIANSIIQHPEDNEHQNDIQYERNQIARIDDELKKLQK